MKKSPLSRKSQTTAYAYSALRKQVEETLLLGQGKIKEAKVQTYWQTARLIHEHILRHDSRAQHFKILARGQESFLAHLSWSHYRELITVPDKQTRIELIQRAQKSGWSSRVEKKGKGDATEKARKRGLKKGTLRVSAKNLLIKSMLIPACRLACRQTGQADVSFPGCRNSSDYSFPNEAIQRSESSGSRTKTLKVTTFGTGCRSKTYLICYIRHNL